MGREGVGVRYIWPDSWLTHLALDNFYPFVAARVQGAYHRSKWKRWKHFYPRFKMYKKQKSYFSEVFRVSSEFLEIGKWEVVEYFKQLLPFIPVIPKSVPVLTIPFPQRLTFLSEVWDDILSDMVGGGATHSSPSSPPWIRRLPWEKRRRQPQMVKQKEQR